MLNMIKNTNKSECAESIVSKEFAGEECDLGYPHGQGGREGRRGSLGVAARSTVGATLTCQ